MSQMRINPRTANLCKCAVLANSGVVVLCANTKAEVMVVMSRGKLVLSSAITEEVSEAAIRFCQFCGRRL